MLFGEPLTTFEPKPDGPVPRQRIASLTQSARRPQTWAQSQMPAMQFGENNFSPSAQVSLLDPFFDSMDMGLFPTDVLDWPSGQNINGHDTDMQS